LFSSISLKTIRFAQKFYYTQLSKFRRYLFKIIQPVNKYSSVSMMLTQASCRLHYITLKIF